ncbi:MAG TPA: hypothetical protein VGL50_04255 [Steroidobacteraceae bacterium]|jgi:hypothetical protein
MPAEASAAGAPAAATPVLQQLQQLLAGIYDLPTPYRVDDFLFTERARLPSPARESDTDEQLLVLEQGSDAEVGLFLDAALLARLASANPLEALNGNNLADYWTALEGVSHFVYLAWNAGHDRAVTLLELELQAEIDKYVASWWLLSQQHPAHRPAELHHLLFERAQIDERLAGERAGLYYAANRYAARFCRRLERRLARMHGETLAELRRFYRLTHQRKVSHIQRYS